MSEPSLSALSLHALDVFAPPNEEGKVMQILHGITLSIGQGEQVAIIGRSGAGKTMLLHTLAASLAPRAGQVLVLGQNPWRISSRARQLLRGQVFLAPQTPPLPPRQRVITTVLAGRLPQWSIWRAACSLFKPHDPLAAWQALQHFGLGDKLYARVDRLSGGERQRCGLARMLLSNAKIFLVDEPLSALDPTLAASTLACIQAQAQARGASLICSLHQVELAQRYFPRLIGIAGGKIVFDMPSDAVTPAMLAALYAGETASPLASADSAAALELPFKASLPPSVHC